MIVWLWRNLWQLSAGKNQVHPLLFLEILQRNCKIVFLGTLGMSGYFYKYYQFVENFCAYLQEKNQFYTPCFSGDTAKICKLILGTLDMSGYKQPKL